MKKQTTIFKCDQEDCQKEIKIDNNQGFPYKSGWKYLYNLNLKYDNSGYIEKIDKHFCSKTCMLKYIRKTIPNKE